MALGAPVAQNVRDDAPNQQLLAVAARTATTDPFTDRFPQPDQLLPRLRALGHYPFSPEFTLGCADGTEIGSRINTATWRTPSIGSYREPRPDGRDVLLNVETDEVHGHTRLLGGWAIAGIVRPRCVAARPSPAHQHTTCTPTPDAASVRLLVGVSGSFARNRVPPHDVDKPGACG